MNRPHRILRKILKHYLVIELTLFPKNVVQKGTMFFLTILSGYHFSSSPLIYFYLILIYILLNEFRWLSLDKSRMKGHF